MEKRSGEISDAAVDCTSGGDARLLAPIDPVGESQDGTVGPDDNCKAVGDRMAGVDSGERVALIQGGRDAVGVGVEPTPLGHAGNRFILIQGGQLIPRAIGL